MFLHDRIDPNDRFRERRRLSRRRRRQRLAVAILLVGAVVAAVAGGATYFSTRGHAAKTVKKAAGATRVHVQRPFRSQPPAEIRGVHVTEGLASLPGKFESYLTLTSHGLNTIELDVKDENGYVGFVSPYMPALARKVGAARPYYDAKQVAREAHKAGVYLIGRVVVFEDPTLTAGDPELGIQSKYGGVWKTPAPASLGWANEYDQRVWKYDTDIAVAAAKAGFDEIQFDYVRFPTDGDIAAAVWPHKRNEPRSTTIDNFFKYAVSRLHPLHVRVSADVFGLSATRDLGIGQAPKRIGQILDAIYPMVYPSHYNPGEFNIIEPEAFPYATVAHSLRDFNNQTRGEKVRIVPWLQDFSLKVNYGLEQVGEQIDAARAMHERGFLLWNAQGLYTSGVLAHSSQ
ncbi:MAG TPA: putative glycoside hydrolase [Gaiellaceae bacterium]|nr:putative glycoside hydrolase [Gaiellaceae bacterium]